METHPLNMAHQQHRRAEAHLKNSRYDEAMQCHHNAAELLLDAMKSTTSSVALESITLQHSYHLKQKDLIKSKKEQYTRVKKAMENLKTLSKDPIILQGNDPKKVEVAIYKIINESDALLNTLKNDDDHRLFKDVTKEDVVGGRKVEKSQQTAVEELQILSQNLHSLVEQLVFQVEMFKDENMTLKERVSYLEKERVKYLNLPSSACDQIHKHNFSALSTAPDGYAAESIPVAIIPPPSKLSNITPIERINQQPHFDLTALKMD